MTKVIEIPFEKLTLELLNELRQHGVEGIMDGDKKALRLTSVYVVDILETNSKPFFGSLD